MNTQNVFCDGLGNCTTNVLFNTELVVSSGALAILSIGLLMLKLTAKGVKQAGSPENEGL